MCQNDNYIKLLLDATVTVTMETESYLNLRMDLMRANQTYAICDFVM